MTHPNIEITQRDWMLPSTGHYVNLRRLTKSWSELTAAWIVSNKKLIQCCPTTTDSHHHRGSKDANKTKTLGFSKLSEVGDWLDTGSTNIHLWFTRYRPSATCWTSYFFEHWQSDACRLTSLLIRSMSVISGRLVWIHHNRTTGMRHTNGESVRSSTFFASWNAFCNSLVRSVVRVRIFCQRAWTAARELRMKTESFFGETNFKWVPNLSRSIKCSL